MRWRWRRPMPPAPASRLWAWCHWEWSRPAHWGRCHCWSAWPAPTHPGWTQTHTALQTASSVATASEGPKTSPRSTSAGSAAPAAQHHSGSATCRVSSHQQTAGGPVSHPPSPLPSHPPTPWWWRHDCQTLRWAASSHCPHPLCARKRVVPLQTRKVHA